LTLKDIAAAAGVSASTVSRIVNSPDDSFASEQTRERVWDIVKKTGYTPNKTARDLKLGKAASESKGAVVCVIPADGNPFFARLLRACEQTLMECGYPSRINISSNDITPGTLPEASGAIVIGGIDENAACVLERRYKNIVYTGRDRINIQADQVISCGYKAAQSAMEHLFSFGHRNIGYVGETAGVCLSAYKDTLLKYGAALDERLIYDTRRNAAGGYDSAKRLLDLDALMPTAVFFETDALAISAMRYLKKMKVKLPDKLSVISIDNIEETVYCAPMLTTVEMPAIEMGTLAARTLASRIQKHHKLPLTIYIPNNLIIRQSVSNLNEGMYI